jgi:hypothetical protein
VSRDKAQAKRFAQEHMNDSIMGLPAGAGEPNSPSDA